LRFSSDSRLVLILRWFGTALSIFLLIYLLSQQGWDEIGEAVSQISLWRFAIAILFVIISRFAVAGRWYVLLRATSEEINWWQSVRLTFSGLFATNFLPTTIGGDVVRLAGAIQYGANGAVIAASLIVDRLVGVFGMALMLPFGIVPLLTWFSSNQLNGGFNLELGFLGIQNFTLKIIWQKGINIFRKIFQALKFWWKKPGSLLASLIFSGIHMLCFFGILWVLLVGLNALITFRLVAGLYSFVYLVTLLPISINGYGLQELSFSLIFSQVGGVSIQHSLTAALIFRTVTLLASLPGAIFVPGIIVGYRATKNTDVTNPQNQEDMPNQSEKNDP
jgi:uncharacterized membrane protein YbhN (UPF0104 family)